MTSAAQSGPGRIRVGVVAIPDAVISTLAGIYDVLNGAAVMGASDAGKRFHVEVIGQSKGLLDLASGLPITVQNAIDQIGSIDIVIVPSLLLDQGAWRFGRYPHMLDWISRMHRAGAIVCSACSGIFLLAETGLWDDRDATLHFAYAREFQERFKRVRVHPERVLVVSGDREELVSSGASNTWHDLVLYLIARHSGAATAQAVARMFALQWHQEGLAPFIVFEGRRDHGDGEITAAQDWIATHYSVADPVGEMIRRSKLAERTFKRRFTAATGLAPLEYTQRLRIEDAKRRLERTETSVAEISWRVGYEDTAFFGRLFKRLAGMSPGAYRKRFRVPSFAQQK